ncbi:TRAF3-interacting JNK-activating modulator-like isoform X3 [Procambarus clarkii]|uniref:TRAF3-interacting JNK-activating modulator-like isoform X3 n=1 Tax=Procambarus clarkii TaxID=6728 RepID=UPI003741F5CA
MWLTKQWEPLLSSFPPCTSSTFRPTMSRTPPSPSSVPPNVHTLNPAATLLLGTHQSRRYQYRLKESWNANRNLGEHEDISGLGVTSKIHQEDDKVWKKEAEKLQKKLRAAEAGHKVILDKVLQESRLLAQQELETLQSQNSYENGKLNNRITLLQEKLSQAMSENLVLRQQSKHIQKMERECINYLSYNEALEKEVNFLRTQLQQAESQVHQERSSLQLLLKTHAEELAKNKEHHRKIAVRFLKNKLRRLDKGQ